MMQQLGESVLRSETNVSKLQLGLNSRNPFCRYQIKDLNNFDQFATEAKKIDDKLTKDKENIE